jgi:predicted aldo/keto reductase-like oxidoreductase
MRYREMGRTGDKVSILGYGCMRFPRKGGRIDEQRVLRQAASAIERGVNYFDTAYVYPGSEAALGLALEKTGMRGRVFVATKLPIFMAHTQQDLENTLNASLERLREIQKERNRFAVP